MTFVVGLDSLTFSREIDVMDRDDGAPRTDGQELFAAMGMRVSRLNQVIDELDPCLVRSPVARNRVPGALEQLAFVADMIERRLCPLIRTSIRSHDRCGPHREAAAEVISTVGG